MAAVEWIASGAAGDRVALVICADIARYGVGAPGEPTQGAGAVAMVIAAEATAGAEAYATQVEPSLGLCAQVGNIYTGSLYLGLAGLLHAQAAGLVGQRIGLFSYGSGCTSEFFSGVVSPRAVEQIAAAGIAEVLAARERISIAEYERIMALPPTAPLVPWPSERAADGFRFVGVSNHQRQYQAG